ncbi:enoyl-ACP reductase FabI [Saccharibacter sp. 17.LH.SD]|uniref:enoyl-ACP reductase FabI n=1 Tax=Saccharibacter sp. 17.LH.SD TaxID=2689393 RepID=UPI001370F4A5|nr:enoyl-ACP reductase FabI [Saccharibacter sp. 17.LH.SD]MXV44524.1 enoyl-ACP reductase FabI [Saccharibacter sp. 17.LH.SD]
MSDTKETIDQAPVQGQLMAGKRGVIMGVANKNSIAWAIASACAAQGAELAFTYQGEALGKRVRPLAESVGSSFVIPCDVSDDAAINETFDAIEKEWGKIDFVLHAIGWADKQYLRGRYVDTPRDAFLKAMDISCFSFTAVARRASAMMNRGGSLLTMTYLGAERVMPHYNVMGVAKAALEASVRYMAADLGCNDIRVNGISAGPIMTLAANGIGDFRYILRWNQYNSPLERNVSLKDVGGSGMYLLSDLSSGVTGEVHHVDCGYNIVGMKNPNAPDISVATGE